MSAKIRFSCVRPFLPNFVCSAPSPQAAEAGACLAPSQEFPCTELPAAVKAAVPLQRLRGSSALPLQPNLFYHKSQCTATFQEELSNKYNVNLSHIFVTICSFWKILPFNKVKRTVYFKDSQALHFLYLCAGKRPRPPNGRGRCFTFSLSGGERYRLQPVPALTWTSPTRRRRGCCRD